MCQDVDILKIHTETGSTKIFTWDLVNFVGNAKEFGIKHFVEDFIYEYVLIYE